MYQKEIYDDLRQRSPDCFTIAENLYNFVLDRNMLVVRALVTRSQKNHMFEISMIEVINLEHFYNNDATSNILLRLEFRSEMDFQNNEIKFLATSLEASGPLWNGKLIQKTDIVNHLATFVSEWAETKSLTSNEEVVFNPWIASKPFVGCLVLSKDTRIEVEVNHPLLLPFLSMCFVSLTESLEEKIEKVTNRILVSPQNAKMREDSIKSLVKRFGSFVVQAQRENARNYFGDFFPS